MRCRYCGKELALLKRLTGGGGFCSDAHKQSYQDEYNQLALSRLLQAQKKADTEPSGKKKGTPVAVEEPVAVQEPVAVGEPVSGAESVAREPVLEGHAEHTAETPLPESLPLQISNLEASVAEDAKTRDARIKYAEQSHKAPAEIPMEREAEPREIADFLSESPGVAVWPEETPHLEPWLEFSSGPAVADWQLQDGAPSLSTALGVSLNLRPNAVPAEHRAAPANLVPLEFANGHGQSTPSWKVTTTHQLPSAGPVGMEIAASAIEIAPDRSMAGELPFEAAVLLEDSQLLELPSTAIEFPTEDSGVVVVQQDHGAAIDSAGPEADAAAPLEDDRPRASLEALSKLHQDLAQPPEPVPAAEAEVEPATPATPTPGRATELLDIAIRMFPPAKPVRMEGDGLPSQSKPLLPNLKSLPLRPKVAVATGYAPPSVAPAQPKVAATTPVAKPQTAPPPTALKATPAKPAPAVRPVARIVQPKQPPASAKVPETSKAAAKTVPPAPARPDTGQPAKPAATQSPVQVKQKPGATGSETAPNFGAVQLANPSFAGSLKVKLGIAIVLIVVACSTWLGWGGRSHKSAADSAISADGSGPSIILGEGGWVEGWGGDPVGVHAERQITIYRPSLKLSDYRVDFRASIETNSIGWVFRAADPDNYYAMKLMAVSTGLSPKVALFKYLVLNGRQTQVGRVPIDLTVQADTVFDIRTDVRGPQFSTSIQGRQVDVWTDDQLKSGGVGFLNEREERGKVKSVSIRVLNGAAN
jgi:hypothetical protein